MGVRCIARCRRRATAIHTRVTAAPGHPVPMGRGTAVHRLVPSLAPGGQVGGSRADRAARLTNSPKTGGGGAVWRRGPFGHAKCLKGEAVALPLGIEQRVNLETKPFWPDYLAEKSVTRFTVFPGTHRKCYLNQ